VENAQALLRPILEQFVEGCDTADLPTADRLLGMLAAKKRRPVSGIAAVCQVFIVRRSLRLVARDLLAIEEARSQFLTAPLHC
jgi:hypothetical protein